MNIGPRKAPIGFILAGTIPTFFLAMVLHVIPVFQGIYTSFFRWSGLSQKKLFVGFDNYQRLIRDNIVWEALGNDLYIVCFKILFTMLLVLMFAGIMFLSFRKVSKVFQSLFFFPNILSVSIVAIVFTFVYNPKIGILNTLLNSFGLGQFTRAWLGNPATALNAVLFPTIWAAVGYQLVIIMAGIGSIPETYLEMATLEGAGRIRQYFSIVLPLISSVIKTSLSLMIINTMNQTFIFVKILTKGGPTHSTEVLGTYMYYQAFENFKFGYGTTVAVVNFLLALILTILVTILLRKETVEYA